MLPPRAADTLKRSAHASNVKPPNPSLPKGGGAHRGLAETLGTDLATGTATLSISIPIPAARAGFAPALTLSYGSRDGNSPFGIGWQLALPRIARRADARLPTYDDARGGDEFLLSGAGPLVPALVEQTGAWVPDTFDTATHTVTRFRPRIEGPFARIECHRNKSTSHTHWITFDRAGVKSTYGVTPGAIIADPKQPRRVYAWLLERQEDPLGNLVVYEHKPEDLAGVHRGVHEAARHDGAAPIANRYLKRIRYGNTVPGDPSSCVFEIVLDHGEHDPTLPTPDEIAPWPCRADPFSDRRPGFDLRTYRLCRRILIFHRFPELGPDPVLTAAVELEHDEQPSVSRLRSLTYAGYHQAPGAAAPAREADNPLVFGYSPLPLDSTVRALDPESAEGFPAGRDSGAFHQWVDLDAEGLPGVLVENAAGLTYKRNRGDGHLTPPLLLGSKPSMTNLRGGLQQLMDLDGNGRLSLVRFARPTAGYQIRTREGGWSAFAPFPRVPVIDWQNSQVHFIDLNGDGRDDILVAYVGGLLWYPSRGTGGFDVPRRLPLPAAGKEPPLACDTGPHAAILIADMTGDGLADIVRVQSGSVTYWPNLGHGHFGRPVTMTNAPSFGQDFHARRVRLADLDGSGTADLIYGDAAGMRAWLNQAGNGFSEPIGIRAFDTAGSMHTLAFVDLFGRGTACAVWATAPWAGARVPQLRYLDLAAGNKPHLLTSMDNGRGLTVGLRYVPSTQFYCEARDARKPWATRLPFPVHVLERVERVDAVSGVRLVSRYVYHHGHYDTKDREFRGFALVEEWDTESLPDAAPADGAGVGQTATVLTRTHFHVGIDDSRGPLSEALSAASYQGDAGAPQLADPPLPGALTVHERADAVRALAGQVRRREIYALDGSPSAAHPYSVWQASYAVRRLQPAGADARAAFFVHPYETVQIDYERDVKDPRIEHTLTLDVDAFGEARRVAHVAYPRRSAGVAAQARLLAILAETDVVHRADATGVSYRLGIPVERRLFELTDLASQGAGLLPWTAVEAAASGAERRLLRRARMRWYDSDNLPAPLPFGEVDHRALPFQAYELAFTAEHLAERYQGRVTAAMLIEEGYVELPGEPGSWWAPGGRAVPDPATFYLPTTILDPFGQSTTVSYDPHALLVVQATDPLGNTTVVENDYRILGPWRVTDPNGNRVAARFDGLGRVVAMAVLGKDGADEGDTLDDPTVEHIYHLDAWRTAGQPAHVTTRSRERHRDPQSRWQEATTYFDGSGRVILKKLPAAPAPGSSMERWVGSGRTVFDDKGNPVKQYEPYFSDTAAYEDDDAVRMQGVSAVLRYDPLGRLRRVDRPDGTHRRIEISPWREVVWDENDTVLEAGNGWYASRLPGAAPALSAAEQRAASLAAAHAGTPAVTELDPLGRACVTVADLGGGATLETRTELDVEGNPLAVIDARGNEASATGYDLLGRPMRSRSQDAGERWTLLDVAGRPVRMWDSRGHAIRIANDVLRRPTERWVSQDGGPEVLAERTLYGEAHPQAAARSLRGRVYRQWDGAGLVTNEAFDFKGNLLETNRRLADDYKTQLDWSASPEPALGAEVFTAQTAYDALNRPASSMRPDGSELRPQYDVGGQLQALDVRHRGAAAFTAFVEEVRYDAKGQRERIRYGNGVVTEYEYDPLTFRLRRLSTSRSSDSALLQDLHYTHDPVGNVVEIEDRAQASVFHGGQLVEPVSRYEYDVLYRLTRAEGREHAGQNADVQQDRDGFPLLQVPHPNDPQAMRRYADVYDLDEVGNLLAMVHEAGSGSWTRRYRIAQDSNRLLATSLPGDPADGPFSAVYTHDAHGNMTAMPHLAAIAWDFMDRQREVDLGGGGKVYAVHDAAGKRARKVWEHSGIIEDRIYLGGFEIYRRREGAQATLVLERETLHVMDDARRIALIETTTVDTSAPLPTVSPRVRWQLADHLGSSALELDDAGLVLSYEEYHPYGTSAYRATRGGVEVSPRRYRYLGHERDDETGLEHRGLRAYAPWLGRWTSADPAGMVDGPNLYAYARGNPLRYVDPSGTQSHEPELVRVPERPKGMPANVTRWAYSGTSVLTGSEERFAELTAGKQVFVFDAEAPAENLAKLKKAEHQRDVEAMSGAMREALGGGGEPAKGGCGGGAAEGAAAGGDAKPKSWLEKFAEEIAYAGAIANVRMGEDTHRPDASPYGIVGGRNANGPQSPVAQGVAGAAMIAAAVLVQTSAFEQALRKAIRTGQKLVYDLSVPAAKKLAERYGWKMAAALEQTGTIAPYAAMKELTAGSGGRYQAHHILEKHKMKELKMGDPDMAPSVILTQQEHARITAALRAETKGKTSKADLWQAYQKVYADCPHWLNAIKHYFF